MATNKKATNKRPLEQITDELLWDPATGEAVRRWRGLTDEQSAGVSAAVLVQVLRGDVLWSSGWTFAGDLREVSGKLAGLGSATAETAARIAAAIAAVLPEELRLGQVLVDPPYNTIELVSTANEAWRFKVHPGIVGAMLVGTSTLIPGDGNTWRVEQYPERVWPVVIGDALREIRLQEERDR